MRERQQKGAEAIASASVREGGSTCSNYKGLQVEGSRGDTERKRTVGRQHA